MKKILTWMLALAFLLTSAAAYAAVGDAVLNPRDVNGYSSEYIQRVFTDGDTLYLDGSESLQTYRVGDSDTTKYTWGWNLPEDLENSDRSYGAQKFAFCCDGKLYAIELVSSYDESTRFEAANLYEVTLAGDGTAQGTLLRQVEWDEMVEDYGTETYARTPDSAYAVNGVLYMSGYNNYGDYQMLALDLETGELRVMEDIQDVYAFTAYRDGTLLVEQYNYNQPSTVRFAVYDPEDESLTPLGEFEVEDYSPFSAIAYDSGSDTLYCLDGGEICPLNLDTGEMGEGVADMPVEVYSNQSACILNGGYYAYCSSAVVVRNLDPTQRAETRLKVYDGLHTDVVTNAYYDFTNANGDVSVAISRDYSENENLVENMMNRDSSVDIYVMSSSDSGYDAVYNRGYMLELSGSEKIKALVDRMYPSIQEALSYDGEIVAVPMQVYGWGLAVNRKTAERLGLDIADVPTNWSDFLVFLKDTLPQYLEKDEKVTLFYAGMTESDAKGQLFNIMFEDYQTYVNYTDPSMGYDTELMHSLLEKLEAIDFAALGLAPDAESESESEVGVVAYEYSDDQVLLETGAGRTFGNFYDANYEPLLMSMDANTPALMPLDMGVAFINPFSEHPETAIQFLEQMVDALPDTLMYNLDPTLNEPIRSSYYETQIEEMNEMLEKLKAELETADPADKQALEENIRDYEQSMEWYENNGWEVSQAQMDWYRAHDDNVVAEPVNWLYSSSTGGEAWNLIQQYLDGQISAAEMLEGIDGKVQMMLMEGN